MFGVAALRGSREFTKYLETFCCRLHISEQLKGLPSSCGITPVESSSKFNESATIISKPDEILPGASIFHIAC